MNVGSTSWAGAVYYLKSSLILKVLNQLSAFKDQLLLGDL